MTIERLLAAGRAMAEGELDRAEQIYRQVAEADPRSSIAVVGLARVALRRGEPDEARRLAQEALSIDPANAAARRLVEREAPVRTGPSGRRPADGDANANAGAGAHHDADRGAAEGADGDGADGADGDGAAGAGEEWPWPDLDEQLARYRQPGPGLLGRLLRRGRRE